MDQLNSLNFYISENDIGEQGINIISNEFQKLKKLT